MWENIFVAMHGGCVVTCMNLQELKYIMYHISFTFNQYNHIS